MEALQNDLILFIVNVGINARFSVRVIHAVTFIIFKIVSFSRIKSTIVKHQTTKHAVVSRASRIQNLCELFCTQLSKTFLLSITLGPFSIQYDSIFLIFMATKDQ